jgi:hypothetical protein
MPYIKPQLRPMFDKICVDASYLQTRPDLYTVTQLQSDFMVAIENLPENKRTGCMNYFFTKTLRFCYNKETSLLLRKIFTRYFFNEQSYSNFERASGFLYRLRHEFKRREWYPQGRCIEPDYIKFIDFLMTLVDEACDEFEDQKIKENGDV